MPICMSQYNGQVVGKLIFFEGTNVYVISFHDADDYNEGETIVSIVALECADDYVEALG